MNYVKINMEPFHIEGFDCYENSLISVLKHFKRDYYYLFRNAWTFDYDSHANVKIWERFNKNECSLLENIQDGWGVRFKYHDLSKVNNKTQFIEQEIMQKRPVIAHINGYYCPTKWEYHREGLDPSKIEYFRHCIIIIGKKDNNYWFIDTAPIIKDAILENADFQKGVFALSTYWENDTVMFADRKDFFSSISVNPSLLDKFVQDLKTVDIGSLFRGEKFVWNEPFYRMIMDIYGGRKQFFYGLNQQIESSKEIDTANVKILEELLVKWNICRTLCMKVNLEKDKKKICEKLFKKICDAVTYEKGVLNFLYTGMGNFERDCNICERMPFYVDLKKYYTDIACFAISILDMKKIREIIKFCEYEIRNENYFLRVINCMNQEIVIEQRKYSKIMVVGYSKRDRQLCNITVKDVDGDEHVIETFFSNYELGPDFGETVLVRQKVYNEGMKGYHYGMLYFKEYPIICNKQIKKIILPYDSNICIVSIIIS